MLHINDLPQEILLDILFLAAKANEEDGPSFTYGQTQIPNANVKSRNKTQKYIRGPVTAEGLRWDATAAIREVCSSWHEWATSYNFEHVFEQRWKGAERWADLTMKREKYEFYELNTRSNGVAVYRDPYGSLKQTDRLFKDFPAAANSVRRLWFNGFHTAESDKLILSIIANCHELEFLSVPWTLLRRGSVEDWVDLLNVNTGEGKALRSLEITAVSLTNAYATCLEEQKTCPNPLSDPRVDFSGLKRLKFFGNTLHNPISDEDLNHIARTATGLECLDFTNLSTITVAGMLALVKASRSTLQVLEHSPRSDDGFYHPFPGHIDEHVCRLIASLPAMRDLSMSVPCMCSNLFSNTDVKWSGDCQVRTVEICACGSNGAHTTTKSNSKTQTNPQIAKLRTTFSAARTLISHRQRLGHELNIEIFYGGCIFYPASRLVHGDFSFAEWKSRGVWPDERSKQPSTKGPYGTSGRYEKEEGVWEVVGEEEFFEAVGRGWIEL